MSSSFRLGAVAVFLVGAALVSSPNSWGDPGQIKKDNRPLLPPDSVRPAGHQGAMDAEAALAQSKFSAGGILTYQPLEGDQLFAWQIKPKLGQAPARPRDMLIVVSTSASQAGVHFIAARQLVEKLMASGGPGDRFSVWLVNMPGEYFTGNITKNFIDPKKDDKQLQTALKILADQYPAGDCDLKDGLARAIDTFDKNEDRQLVLLYLGDGQSNAAPITAADRTALVKKMVDRKIAFFPVPLGMEMDPTNLHGLATGTGGIVIRVSLMQDKAEDGVGRIQQTLAAPILYPTKMQMPNEVVECFPNRLPPLRGDAPTLFIGKMKGAKKMTAVVEGHLGGKAAKMVYNVSSDVNEAELDNYFLVSMLNQWKNAKDQPALIRADRALAFAYEHNRLIHDDLLSSAQLAMHKRDLAAAARLYEQAVQLAPHDREAKEGLKFIEGLKSGKIDPQKVLKQLDAATQKLVKLDKKGVVRLTADELAKLAPQPDAAQQPKPGDPGKWAEDALKAQRDRIILEEQLLSQQVDSDIRSAMKELRNDPDGAHERLRTALLRVKDHPDIGENVREGLLRRLQATLRTVSTDGREYKLLREQEQRAKDLAIRQLDKAVLQKTEEERFEASFRYYRSLLNEARYDEIHRQALTAEILQGMHKLQEDARIKGLPVPPATQAASMQASVGYNLQVQNDIRVQKERNFLAIMLEVDKSHIPLPDEPPIHFMNRLPAAQQLKAWELLTERRKNLWENTDFFSDAAARAEADNLSKLLDSIIETKDYQLKASLKEHLGLMQDKLRLGVPSKELPILIDAEAFKEGANAESPDIYETQTQLPQFPSKMSIATAIRVLLSNVATKNATYLIRRNYVEITTIERQYSEKALRVFPVGDLVIPISGSTNPFTQQMGGVGQFGGGGVGQIGGGFGQIGGGFGQLGGGGIRGGGFGQIGGGLGQIGGGFGQIGGGFGQIGGGFGQLGGGFGQIGGGFGQIGGGFGQIGGGLGQLGGVGGFGQFGGAGFGVGAVSGGPSGAQIPGQNCLGFNQFNGGLGAFGTGGLDQGLILLIKQVVAPGEWGGQNCRLQYSGFQVGGNPLFGPGGNQAQNPGGPGLPGFPGNPGIGGNPDPTSNDPTKLNNIAFYPPALALVVQGTTRKHYKDTGSYLGARKPGIGLQVATLEQARDKPGMFEIGKGKAVVADAKGKQGDNKNPILVADLDPRTIWQDALSKGMQNPGLVIATADFLFDEGYFEHAAEFLKANLRQGIIVQPWVYEALAVALEFSGAHPQEIQRARLSALSLNPKDAGSYVKAAQASAEHGEFHRALAFCQQAAKLQPGLPNAYSEALAYAEKAQDIKSMEWAVTNLLSQDWAEDNQTLHLKANKNVDRLVGSLQENKRPDEAAKLLTALQKLKQRDLVIHLTWQPGPAGDADLELEIKEPTGTVCSSQYRTTPGGGTLSGLTLTTQRKATYTAGQAFSGEYQITVKRLWGQPGAGQFRLEIIQHQGTPQEARRIESFSIDQLQSVKFVLAKGRRTDLAKVAPALALPRESKDEEVKSEHVLTKLRNIADPVSSDRVPRGVAGAIGKSPSTLANLPAPPAKKQQEQLVFQSGSGSGAGGVFLTTQGHLSPDGRFLRVSLNPVFQPSAMGTGAPRVDMPLIPGGSGL